MCAVIVGMLVTLLLDKVVIENNQFLENGLPIFWNILEERIAAVLMVSSLDIVLWDTRQLGSSVEVTLPARAASRLSHLMPVPCDRLKKLGVMTACLGEINATTDGNDCNICLPLQLTVGSLIGYTVGNRLVLSLCLF